MPGPPTNSVIWLSSLPLWLSGLTRKWVMPCLVTGRSYCPLTILNLTGLSACKWFHVRSHWLPSDYSHYHSCHVGLKASEWDHVKLSWMPSDCPHSHSGLVGLIACEWFGVKLSWVPANYPTAHLILLAWLERKWVVISHQIQLGVSSLSSLPFCPIGFTACEWFHSWFTWVTSQHPHFHSLPVGLIASGWFYVKSSFVCSDCFHSHYDFALGLIGSEWFYGRSNPWVPFLTNLTPILVLLNWQLVSDFMTGPAGCLMTVLTPALVLLAPACELFHAIFIWVVSDCDITIILVPLAC